MTSKQPIALVTGATAGIGEAIAHTLLANGYLVYGTSRRVHTGQRPFPLLALDVTQDDSVDAAVAELMQRAGRIDLLVNNAGIGVEPAAAEESSLEQAKAIFDTNFLGIVRMTRAVVPHMRHHGSGRIINIGSILGAVAVPYVALYAASKHAVAGYSQALDHELRTHGIRVSVVEPAYTRTAFDTNNLHADAKLAVYQQIRTHLAKVVGKAMEDGDAPGVVAKVVLQAAQAARPKLRYTSGKIAAQLRFLSRFAPARVLDAGIRKSLKLNAVG